MLAAATDPSGPGMCIHACLGVARMAILRGRSFKNGLGGEMSVEVGKNWLHVAHLEPHLGHLEPHLGHLGPHLGHLESFL